MRKVLAAKLHGIPVAEANLHYHGSITPDPDRCHKAGILPMEFVEIWNKNSGVRSSTYVIFGARGSRCCVLKRAAARTRQVGDQIIICSSSHLDEGRIVELRLKSLTSDRSNRIADRLAYSVSSDVGWPLWFRNSRRDRRRQKRTTSHRRIELTSSTGGDLK